MSTQGGLKHAATEPAHLDNKRDVRRRGAEGRGRAAALRRAPSDSDCSGETASLSADSNERLRPIPPLPSTRANKTRSRRRGSEWEVLEGLKDGQRFERRPDVFNGYLHKKRKWPLKGWHKRFFVVDGGILVYARSPTDVARGRLHGSVDVGLSVISAKARRRRIDIDADEFIYHLRAKTPEVFRTWLNVLKTHRLYRQHLLTFGARESAPKIHAPLEDLPPTDTSSRGTIFTQSSSESSRENPRYTKNQEPTPSFSKEITSFQSPLYINKEPLMNTYKYWHEDPEDSSVLMPLRFEPLELEMPHLNPELYNRSMCSMKCMGRIYEKDYAVLKKTENESSGITETECLINSSELDRNSMKNNSLERSVCDHSNDKTNQKEKNIQPVDPVFNELPVTSKSSQSGKKYLSIFEKKVEPTTALFLFSKRKKDKKDKKKARLLNSDDRMKRSNKSTNVVKYKNSYDEPPLKTPLSKSVLLKRYKLKVSRQSGHDRIATQNDEVQVVVNKESKSQQDRMTSSEYDRIAEKLINNIFQKKSASQPYNTTHDVQFYVNHMVKELYDMKYNQINVHPVKVLFRCLLEYWLKNSSTDCVHQAVKQVKSVNIQSHAQFMQDKQLSSLMVTTTAEQTQFHGFETFQDQKIDRRRHGPNKQATYSFLKERRIQELERLLKSTVYTCETMCNNRSKEKDIAITRKLIDNIDNPKVSENSTSDSSTEFPEIQETFNHLISETSIPPDVAKEFLAAYLDVLVSDGSTPGSTPSTDESKESGGTPACDVQAESVQRRMSKGVITASKKENDKLKARETAIIEHDPGQKYLKDVLDRITAIFSKTQKTTNKNTQHDVQPDDTKVEGSFPSSKTVKNELISENKDSIIVDLTKYRLDHISMYSESEIQGMMSITLKLKERPPSFGESKQKNLNLKFSEEKPPDLNRIKGPDGLPSEGGSNKKQLQTQIDPKMSLKNPYIDYDPNLHKERIELKPFLSTSDATSKAFRFMYESEHSCDVSSKTANLENYDDSKKSFEYRDDLQPCYVLSSFKKSALSTTSQLRKKMFESVPVVSAPEASTSPTKRPEITEVDKSNPKIIDEKFILLLLENLTLLSQNVPGLHRDIYNLYSKLKKKHDKDLRQSTYPRLGLLGKIYNDNTDTDDNETKLEVGDVSGKRLVIKPSKVEIGLNTSIVELRKIVHRSVSVLRTLTQTIDVKLQTDDISQKKKSVAFVDGQVLTSKELCCVREKACVNTLDVALSNTNWFERVSKECSTTYIFSKDASCENLKYSTDNVPIVTKNKDEVRIVLKSDKNIRDCSQPEKKVIRKPLIGNPGAIFEGPNPIRALDRRGNKKAWPINAVIGQASQETVPATEKKFDRKMWISNTTTVPKVVSPEDKKTDKKPLLGLGIQEKPESTQVEKRVAQLKNRKVKKDFNVYQLFLSNVYKPTLSSSLSSSNVTQRSDDLKTLYRCSSVPSYCSESGGPLENASRELGQAQLSVQQLQRLLEALELQHQHHDNDQVSLEGASPSVKKDRRKFGLRKKKSGTKCASVELAPALAHHHTDPASASHMALSALTAPPSPGGGASSVPNSAASLPMACAATRPQSLPGPGSEHMGGPASLSSLTPDHQLREDFTVLAKDLLHTLKGVVSTLVCERGRLRAAMETAETATAGTPGGAMVAALRTNLNSALQQNSELRSRLSRIHDASDLAEISSVNNTDNVGRPFPQSLSFSSSCVSASEFFDAEEHEDQVQDIIPADEAGVIELDGDSSSEAGSLSSEEGAESASSDNSDGALVSAEPVTVRVNGSGPPGAGAGGGAPAGWARRTRLPCPRPTPGGPSLWNLLYKNIGKDLSQVSMPVTINEPLNMLQRLCEELEYSELLDAASACPTAMERMCLVAAFAVSAYSSSAHRAASKPFNPLLQETFECVRQDRGFRFLAEQVSHHPPISACHAESPRWCFWQEARIKTKFWGKSMEFQPAGRVHVRLLPHGDHYSWNKVTTCVHNLFGGQRWVDQYGDMHIVCHGTEISAKLNFIKASSWSSSRHEVRGWVTEGGGGGGGAGGARVRLQGRWSEALYAGEPPSARCLWRPGAMPPEHDIYYGFTRFAMELNEMEPGLRELLPHTDTRFRPDQRALEEGDVEAAERAKHELEQAQRDRRRRTPDHTPYWFRKVCEDGEEVWVFTGEYWLAREQGFPQLGAAPRIW